MPDTFATWRHMDQSVGKLGRNQHDDVVAVQELLNDVPVAEGGPYVKLTVDGKYGDKTLEAIQKFQLKQFGWGGADGLVEPYKQTHRRLCDFYGPSLTNTALLITRSVVDRIGAEWEWEAVQSEKEWYYRIEDHATTRTALYWLSPRPGATALKPRPGVFRGRATPFSVKAPGGARVTDLSCHGIYTTRDEGAFVTSHLILSLPTGAASLQMESVRKGAARRPTAADRGYVPTIVPPSYWGSKYRREGAFQFITELE